MAYIVSLKQFDGPLDLLLTLISDAKIAIEEIFISEITEQYLSAMKLVGTVDMDSASEFLQMASTLVEIKSRSLLPKPPKPEDPNELSPEEALIKQLTEYKAFKEASEKMHRLEEEARALMTKMPEEYPLPPPNVEIVGLTLEKLVKAFSRVLERAEANDRADVMAGREIRRDRFTVSGCMARIARKVKHGSFRFTELFTGDMSKSEVITMFLAVLEMTKLSRVHLEQDAVYEDILLSEAKTEAEAGTMEGEEA